MIAEKIKQLKLQKNAVILAHYYVSDEVQEIADYIGDSFYLSKIATGIESDTIVFCGVSFMGESAKILNPNKVVIMPDETADCALVVPIEGQYVRCVFQYFFTAQAADKQDGRKQRIYTLLPRPFRWCVIPVVPAGILEG